jgi:maltose O-acetyltransferase
VSPASGAQPESPRTMLERMRAGEPCLPSDPEVSALRTRAQRLCERYNATPHDEGSTRRPELLRQLLGSVGSDVIINPNFRCDYGAMIHIGDRAFVNFDCVFLDGAEIQIGADCWIAPQVQLITVNHAIDPSARRAGWEVHRPVTLGENVWLGAGALVLPGVSIGADTVVGAGAVVSASLPAGVVAVGNPARVLREIDARDRLELPPI